MSSVPRRYEELTEDEWKRLETIEVRVPEEIGLRLWKTFDEDKALSLREILRKAREWLRKKDEAFRSRHDNNVMTVIDQTRGALKKELISYWKYRYAWLLKRLKRQGVSKIQFVDKAYGGFEVQYFKGDSRVKVVLKRHVRKHVESEEELEWWADELLQYEDPDDWYDRQLEYQTESVVPYIASVRVVSCQRTLDEFGDKGFSGKVRKYLGGD